jgi:hypothetical protein
MGLGSRKVGVQFAELTLTRSQLGFHEIAVPASPGPDKAKEKRKKAKGKREKGNRDSASCPHPFYLLPFERLCEKGSYPFSNASRRGLPLFAQTLRVRSL